LHSFDGRDLVPSYRKALKTRKLCGLDEPCRRDLGVRVLGDTGELFPVESAVQPQP
jgi:hypothetical protein